MPVRQPSYRTPSMMMMMMMTVERREGANSYSRDAFPCALQTTGFSSFYMRRAAHAPPIQCGTLCSALLSLPAHHSARPILPSLLARCCQCRWYRVITNRQVVETSLLPAYIDKSTEISLSENNAQMANKLPRCVSNFFLSPVASVFIWNMSLLNENVLPVTSKRGNCLVLPK
jgi:hypothetical protein